MSILRVLTEPTLALVSRNSTVSYYVTVNKVIEIKHKTAVIRYMEDCSTREYTLVLPTNIECDPIKALDTKEYVDYLMKELKYVPVQEGNKVKLKPPLENHGLDSTVLGTLQKLCDEMKDRIKHVAGKETLYDLLTEFREMITKATIVEELYVAQKLLEAIKQLGASENIKRVQALFASLQHNYTEAAALFTSLGNELFEQNRSQAISDYEEALSCVIPETTSTLMKLERVFEIDPERIKNYYLFRYLQVAKVADCDKALFNQERKESRGKKDNSKLQMFQQACIISGEVAKKCFDEAKKRGDNFLLELACRDVKDDVAVENAKKIVESDEVKKKSSKGGDPSKSSRQNMTLRGSLKNVMGKNFTHGSESPPPMKKEPGKPMTLGRRSEPVHVLSEESVSGAEEPVAHSPSNLLGSSVRSIKSFASRLRGSQGESPELNIRGFKATSEEGKEAEKKEKSSPKKKEYSYDQMKFGLGLALKGNDKATLAKQLPELWKHYSEKQNWRKAEIIARIMVDKIGGMNNKLKYIKALAKNNKIEEATQLLYGWILDAYRAEDKENVRVYCSKLTEIDSTWKFLNLVQKRIAFLLSHSTPKGLEYDASPRRHEVRGESCFIGKKAFFMNHPEYVACYVDVGCTFLLGTKYVRVETSSTESSDYPLVLPYHPKVNLRETLSRKELIQNYIRQGYVPVIDGDNIRLQEPGKENLEDLKGNAESIIAILNDIKGEQKNSVIVSLQEFVQNISVSLGLARVALERAVENCNKYKNNLKSVVEPLNKLYADFLFARQRLSQASPVYYNLGQRCDNSAMKVHYFTRAYVCSPSEKIDHILEQLKETEWNRQQRYLTTYLLQEAAKQSDKAEECYKGSKDDPYIHLARLNQLGLEHADERVNRMVLRSNIFGKIAASYEKRSLPFCAGYYLNCKKLEQSNDGNLSTLIHDILGGCNDQPTRKRVSCQILDVFLTNGDIDRAAQALKIIHDIFILQTSEVWKKKNKISPFRFDGDESASLGRRELEIQEQLADVSKIRETTIRLFACYNKSRKNCAPNFEKAHAVSLLAVARTEEFEKEAIQALESQDKKEAATRASVDFAFNLIVAGKFHRAAEMLELTNQFDPDLQFFNPDEKFMIRLMEKKLANEQDDQHA